MQLHARCSCSSSPEELQLLQTAAAAAPAFLHTTLELQIKLQPAVPRMQLQLLSPAAQKCISNCSWSCPKELQLLQTAVAAVPKLQLPRPFPHQD